MVFEEALKALRFGLKITHPHFDTDVYFMACKIKIMGEDTIITDSPISIAKMKGDKLHPDMMTGSLDRLPKDFDKPCKHGNYPQINLLLLMSDDWQFFKEKEL